MKFAALVAWVLAGVVGLYLLVMWLANGGLTRQATKVTRFPTMLVLAHSLMAVAGLVTWILYLTTTRVVYAWAAFATLVVVVLLGFVLLTRWLVGRGGRHARGGQQQFPATAVVLHGLVAVATFVLVFAVALTVGRS